MHDRRTRAPTTKQTTKLPQPQHTNTKAKYSFKKMYLMPVSYIIFTGNLVEVEAFGFCVLASLYLTKYINCMSCVI